MQYLCIVKVVYELSVLEYCRFFHAAYQLLAMGVRACPTVPNNDKCNSVYIRYWWVKKTHIPPPFFPFFVIFRLFNTENYVLLIKTYCCKRFYIHFARNSRFRDFFFLKPSWRVGTVDMDSFLLLKITPPLCACVCVCGCDQRVPPPVPPSPQKNS